MSRAERRKRRIKKVDRFRDIIVKDTKTAMVDNDIAISKAISYNEGKAEKDQVTVPKKVAVKSAFDIVLKYAIKLNIQEKELVLEGSRLAVVELNK